MSSSATYQIKHQTTYRYSGDVVHSHQLLHLTPRESSRQTCTSHYVSIQPGPTHSTSDVDAFGNPVLRLEFDRQHQSLDVVADMSVEVRSVAARVLKSEPWERVRSQLSYSGRPIGAERLEAMRFRAESPHVRIKQMLTDYAAECFPAGRTVLESAESLTHK